MVHCSFSHCCGFFLFSMACLHFFPFSFLPPTPHCTFHPFLTTTSLSFLLFMHNKSSLQNSTGIVLNLGACLVCFPSCSCLQDIQNSPSLQLSPTVSDNNVYWSGLKSECFNDSTYLSWVFEWYLRDLLVNIYLIDWLISSPPFSPYIRIPKAGYSKIMHIKHYTILFKVFNLLLF